MNIGCLDQKEKKWITNKTLELTDLSNFSLQLKEGVRLTHKYPTQL